MCACGGGRVRVLCYNVGIISQGEFLEDTIPLFS